VYKKGTVHEHIIHVSVFIRSFRNEIVPKPNIIHLTSIQNAYVPVIKNKSA